MTLFIEGEQLLTKRNLGEILGQSLITVDTAYGATWIPKSYDPTENGGLKDFDSPNRVSIFPISIPVSCKKIEVDFKQAQAGTSYGYYFTSVKEYNIPKTLIYQSGWIDTEIKEIEIPDGSKFFGFCIALPQNDTPDNSSKYANVQILMKMTINDFLQRKEGTIIKLD